MTVLDNVSVCKSTNMHCNIYTCIFLINFTTRNCKILVIVKHTNTVKVRAVILSDWLIFWPEKISVSFYYNNILPIITDMKVTKT